MIQADNEPILVGLAPKVEVIAASTESMNRARAQQSPSVAINTDPQRLPDDDVVMSLFVHLDPELDEASRDRAVSELTEQARRVRWKSNAAIVEISPVRARELRRIHGVAYVETGLSLSAPNPTDSQPDQAPDSTLRHVTACEEFHKHGAGVLVGIIDVGGFDFAHPDFLDNKHTRWEAIWDQGGDTRPPPSESGRPSLAGFDYGALIRKKHMDAAIDAAEARKMGPTRLEPQSQRVPGSHGTHVASIAAGNLGVANKAHIAGVLIDLGEQSDTAATSFYDSTRVTDAIDYLLDLAAELGEDGEPLCVSINISLGTNGHAHDASSLTAQWIDHALTTRGRCISVASGNAGQTQPEKPDDRNVIKGRIHAKGTLQATGLRKDLVWIVEGNDSFSDVSENEMEIWYGAQDRFEVSIKPPGGTWSESILPTQKALNKTLDNGTVVNVVSETYYPTNGLNRISITLVPSPGNNGDGAVPRRIAPGEWTVRLTGMEVRDGTFDAWIERDDPRKRPGTKNLWDFPSYFAEGSYVVEGMINSLGCPERVIAVANIDAKRDAVNITSSRGPTRDKRLKPDIGADGTKVVAACGFDPHTQWKSMTGTSMASPFVCGVAALMLAAKTEDPNAGVANPPLTAAQLQGIMRATSIPLIGYDFGWRNDTGFGLINPDRCVFEAAYYNKAAQ
jgi:subtilisin family serine protease